MGNRKRNNPDRDSGSAGTNASGWTSGNLEFLIYFSMPLFALGCLVMWILVAMAKALFESDAEQSVVATDIHNASYSSPATTTLAPGSNSTSPGEDPGSATRLRRSLIDAFVSRKRSVLRIFAIIFMILFFSTFIYAVLRFKWFRKIACLHVLVIKYCDKWDTYEEGDVQESDKGGDYVSPFEKQKMEKEKQQKLLQQQDQQQQQQQQQSSSSSSSSGVPEIKIGNTEYNNKHQADEELEL